MSHVRRLFLPVDQRLQRARDMVGQAIEYHLGHGGRDPGARDAFDHTDPFFAYQALDGTTTHRATCDCSGLAAWVQGLDRLQPGKLLGLDFDADSNGVWFNCETIVEDAKSGGLHHVYRAVPHQEEVKPGDLVVFGPRPHHPWGHVAVVESLLPGFREARDAGKGWGPRAVIIHCAPFLGHSDVHKTTAEVFENEGRAYFVRLQLDGKDAP